MKLTLLVNPTASSVTAKSQVAVAKMLDAEHDIDILLTDGRGHATELAAQAGKSEAEAMVVFGGDGTLNEVANGLVKTETDMALGVLPGGSTNVFSRILGQDDDPLAATEQVLRAVGSRAFRKINLGSVNDRIFLFHAGVGFDARVVEKVERKPDLKRWLAHPLFTYRAVSTWLFDFDKSAPHFTVSFGDGDLEGAARSVKGSFSICLNANPYTYLGSRPFNLAPADAGLDKELVSITATSMKLRPMLNFVRKSLFGKRAAGKEKGKGLRGVSGIHYQPGLTAYTITSEKEFPYQVDGDFLGYTTELKFSHCPDGLNLISP